jgi:hypothetical protein
MKQNMMILSEREIKKLVKQILLKEDSENKTIAQIQDLLLRKGRAEVGTSDGKAGLNTLTAINNVLNLGLSLYRPQQTAKQNTQTNAQQNILKSPSAGDFEKINPASKDGNLQGVNMNQGTEITPVKSTDYAANNMTGKKEYVAPTKSNFTDPNEILGLTDSK